MAKPALPRTAPRALLLGVGIGAALLVAFALALLFGTRIASAARQEIAHDAQDQAARLAEARSAILTREPDADSVTLGKVAIDWIGETPAVCGQVDIEEPQDSLDGAERFVFVDGQLTLESLDGTAAVDAKWQDVCDDV